MTFTDSTFIKCLSAVNNGNPRVNAVAQTNASGSFNLLSFRNFKTVCLISFVISMIKHSDSNSLA